MKSVSHVGKLKNALIPVKSQFCLHTIETDALAKWAISIAYQDDDYDAK